MMKLMISDISVVLETGKPVFGTLIALVYKGVPVSPCLHLLLNVSTMVFSVVVSLY
jgi:hypothetical protein